MTLELSQTQDFSKTLIDNPTTKGAPVGVSGMSELFAGCAKNFANVPLLTRPTVRRADFLSRMIWEARDKSPNGKLAGSRALDC
jgi:hypothetical protein